MQERKYSYIYSELVKHNHDMVGLLAYSLYKQEKIDFIDQFTKMNGKGPTDDEIKDQFTSIKTDSRVIDSYRRNAEDMYAELSNAMIDRKLKNNDPKLIEKALKKKGEEIEQLYIQKLKDTKLRYSWAHLWSSIRDGVVGNFGFVIALFIIAFVLKASTISLADIFRQVFENNPPK